VKTPRRVAALAALLCMGLLPRDSAGEASPGDSLDERGWSEPPPESATDADWEIERSDSLADDALEVELGAAGSRERLTRRSRRVRFRGDGLSGSVREGRGDPLAGGVLDTRLAGGRLAAGTSAPRWGRGLVLGAPPDPWSLGARDRGAGDYRGRSGEALRYERDGAIGVDALAGRFSRRGLGGARLAAGGAALGVLAAPRAPPQGSLALERGDAALECALDSRGTWRAEWSGARRLASGDLALRLRGGSEGVRSLAEPRRSGPARALGAAFASAPGDVRWLAHGSMWRWRPGAEGARGALELRMRLAQHDAIALGFEEQRGLRRAPQTLTDLQRAGRSRQGVWATWRGETPGLTLELGQEAWGGRFARDAVRTLSAAAVEAAPIRGVTLRATHAVYRATPGESFYFADAEGGRLVLRALSGRGSRTRLETELPAGGGRVRAALQLWDQASRPRTQWTVEWTRRARTRGREDARGVSDTRGSP
jgi:hypothetical protein